MITDVRSIERIVRPISLDIYDKEMQATLLDLFAQVTAPMPQEADQNILLIEWLWAFPQLREWIGDRQTQGVFKDALTITPKNFEITHSFNQNELGTGKALATVQQMSPAIMRAVARDKAMLAMALIRANALTYDGQNLIDTDHLHPDASTFSNSITATRAVAATPTVIEIRSEMKLAQERLLANHLLRNTVLETNVVDKNLVAIARSQAVWSVLNDLLVETEIDDEPNRFKGTFRLLRDYDPGAAPANSWDLILALPGGPRPTIFVPIKEPKGIELDETQKFRNGVVFFGVDARYGVQTAFPQSIVRTNQA